MYLEKRSCLLAVEFSEVEILSRMFTVKHKRVKLLKSFQGLINHGSNVLEELIQDFAKLMIKDPNKAIIYGIKIGSFFNEGGWYDYTIKILTMTENLCKNEVQTVDVYKKYLECYHKCVEFIQKFSHLSYNRIIQFTYVFDCFI